MLCEHHLEILKQLLEARDLKKTFSTSEQQGRDRIDAFRAGTDQQSDYDALMDSAYLIQQRAIVVGGMDYWNRPVCFVCEFDQPGWLMQAADQAQDRYQNYGTQIQ